MAHLTPRKPSRRTQHLERACTLTPYISHKHLTVLLPSTTRPRRRNLKGPGARRTASTARRPSRLKVSSPSRTVFAVSFCRTPSSRLVLAPVETPPRWAATLLPIPRIHRPCRLTCAQHLRTTKRPFQLRRANRIPAIQALPPLLSTSRPHPRRGGRSPISTKGSRCVLRSTLTWMRPLQYRTHVVLVVQRSPVAVEANLGSLPQISLAPPPPNLQNGRLQPIRLRLRHIMYERHASSSSISSSSGVARTLRRPEDSSRSRGRNLSTTSSNGMATNRTNSSTSRSSDNSKTCTGSTNSRPDISSSVRLAICSL